MRAWWLALLLAGAGTLYAVRAEPWAPAPPVTTPAPAAATAALAAPSATAPPPAPTPTAGPSPDRAVRDFLLAWEEGRFADMHRLLTAVARAGTPEDRFVGRYRAITGGAGLLRVRAVPGAAVAGADRVSVPFEATYETDRVGTFAEPNTLPLILEDGRWAVDWSPDLIFRGLTGDRAVRLDPDDPVRGAILDRDGQPLAAQGSVASVGVVPGRVADPERAVAALADVLGADPADLRRRIAAARPDWWVPLKDFPASRRPELQRRLAGVAGALVESTSARVYPLGPAAAHAVGYVSPLTEDDARARADGSEAGELVGRAGVEAWADEALAGTRGGRLAIVDADGEVVRVIAERPARDGASVQLAIDGRLQRLADEILGEKTGSVVVLDPRDGGVLALASRPSFDPNGFVLGFADREWRQLADDPGRPFQARPTRSVYATGSVFKIVTMAAGLERGGYRPETPMDCPGTWTIPGTRVALRDWLPQGHGRVSYAEGLVTSCNPVFYETGFRLNGLDPDLLPAFARGFGFGAPTGLRGLSESAGTVPDPAWKRRTLGEEWFPGDAVNLAIGQGYLEATPLQVAAAYGALAAGGGLRSPVLVRAVTGTGGRRELRSEERGRVPAGGEALAAIRAAMRQVAASPRGTAYYAFRGYPGAVAAKTGSAENQGPNAHAWFAGYAPADDPRVVVVVMVEGGRAGSEVAAPLARKVFEAVGSP